MATIFLAQRLNSLPKFPVWVKVILSFNQQSVLYPDVFTMIKTAFQKQTSGAGFICFFFVSVRIKDNTWDLAEWYPLAFSSPRRFCSSLSTSWLEDLNFHKVLCMIAFWPSPSLSKWSPTSYIVMDNPYSWSSSFESLLLHVWVFMFGTKYKGFSRAGGLALTPCN